MESDSSQDGAAGSNDYLQASKVAKVDLSNIRGITSKSGKDAGSETDLENLAELVPGIKVKNSKPGRTEPIAPIRANGQQQQQQPTYSADMLHDSGNSQFDMSGGCAGDQTTRTDDLYNLKGTKRFAVNGLSGMLGSSTYPPPIFATDQQRLYQILPRFHARRS
jgi:hypothetical protein